MTVESAVYINGLNATLPIGSDQKAEGANHIRLLKTTVKASFPNVTGAVTASHTELNTLVGASGTVVTTTASQTLTNKTLTSPLITGPLTAGITDLTTIGNTVLGDATTDTFNVGNGGIVKDSSGNVGIGAASTGPRLSVTTTAQTICLFDSTHASKGFTSYTSSGVAFGFVGNSGALISGGANTNLGVRSESALDLSINAGTLGLRITTAGVIQDGSANELGFKGLPAASVTTGAFVAADRGKCVNASAGVTVPNAVMSATDVVYIDNQSGGAITVTAAITTLKLAGTASTGNRTLAADGFATIRFRSGTVAVISGPGLS